VFHAEQQRPAYRLGFMGRRLHWLYTRAGRQKILRAERMASEASAQIAARDKALALANASTEQALLEKRSQLETVREASNVAAAAYAEQLKQKEDQWE